MADVGRLLDAIAREAKRAAFPVDEPVYSGVGKPPLDPILFAGSLSAPICVFGRDLGKDEVAAGEPLIGAGGRLVRSGFYRHAFGKEPAKSDRRLESILGDVLLTNTVPYKPPGNKAYSDEVKERFRPFLEEFLVEFWSGRRIITLGTESYLWFSRYASPGAAESLWTREDRYETELPCVLRHGSREKPAIVAPLPHPSPLNAKWYKKFPELLARRLNEARP